MKSRALLPILAAAAFAASCAPQAKPDRKNFRTLPKNFVQGSFVVTADVTTSESQIEAAAKSAGTVLGCAMKAPERVSWGDPSEEGAAVLSEDMLNTFNVKYENCDLSQEGTKSLVAALAGQSLVLSAEPEALAAAVPVENDPKKSQEDHLKLIKRDKACSTDKSAEPIIVAIIDSGVDVDHEDLKDVFLRDSLGEIVGANFVGSSSQMPPDKNFDDGNGHGTHVAGLVGAAANNGAGVVGVASCANIKIMPIRVLNDEGSGNSIEIERGVKWAADHGAHVINLSLGYTSSMFGGSGEFYRSVYANLRARDVVVFAAAGNDGYVNGSDDEEADGGKRYHFPSSYDNVIAVAATTSYGDLTSFSNRGERVDIAAPGNQVLSTIMTGGYGRMSGTSMASPVAAGAYALAIAVAKHGLDGQDRPDAALADEILKASVLEKGKFTGSQVQSEGVIDVEAMVLTMAAKFPKAVPTAPTLPAEPITPTEPTLPAEPTQPTTPPLVLEPTQPTQPTLPEPATPIEEPKAFGFDGLASGDRPAWPQTLTMANLPQGTASVSFYWGKSTWSFAKAYVNGGSLASLTAKGRWYLYGDRTLKAVAYSKSWRVLGTVKIDLDGY